MNVFGRLFNNKTKSATSPNGGDARNFLTIDDNFSNVYTEPHIGDTYLLHAWVNIAVNILIRNIARADFTVKMGGEDITCGPLFDLFHRPNPELSRYDLWKETAAWWHIEGEAFWWFGPDYSGGLPKELYILDPRKMRHERELYSGIGSEFRAAPRRWFYHSGAELIPILADELIHFREWNPWNPVRGVNPLLPLALELEQDYYANKANSQLLKHNAIPQGILKTEQTLRPEEADQIER